MSSHSKPFGIGLPRAKASIFQVHKSVPHSEAVSGGAREIVIHKRMMNFEGTRGQLRISLREIYSTAETSQENRRDIYHVFGGSGSVVIDGREHRIRRGSLVVVAPH